MLDGVARKSRCGSALPRRRRCGTGRASCGWFFRRWRGAITGRFVSTATAARHLNTTITDAKRPRGGCAVRAQIYCSCTIAALSGGEQFPGQR
jgi:hypothetical protein